MADTPVTPKPYVTPVTLSRLEAKSPHSLGFPNCDKRNCDSVTSVTPDSSVTLSSLAARVARLTPSHRDPERFHVEKSEVVAELRRLARERRA